MKNIMSGKKSKSFKKYFIEQELKLSWFRRQEWLQPAFFFLLVIFLFPIVLPVKNQIYKVLFPGLLWVAIFLTHLLSVSILFQSDRDDGSALYWLTQPFPLSTLMRIKQLCHCSIFAIIILMLIPAAMILFQIPYYTALIDGILIILAAPTLTGIGALIAALTLPIQRGMMLSSLLSLPLYIPLLIFTSEASNKLSSSLPIQGELAILAAFAICSIVFIPKLIAFILRYSLLVR